MSDALPDDCIVLRPCKTCRKYEWMQEWRYHCDEHHAVVLTRRAAARRQRQAREQKLARTRASYEPLRNRAWRSR